MRARVIRSIVAVRTSSSAILQLAIADARLPQQLGPPHLEILKKLGMVQVAHRVAFGIPDPDGKFAKCRTSGLHATIVNPPGSVASLAVIPAMNPVAPVSNRCKL